MSLVLDAGALVALDRNERPMWTRLKAALVAGDLPITHARVLGQVWRGGPRQPRLAQALNGIDIRPLDDILAKSAGELLALAKTDDVTDAAVVLLAGDDDEIVTGDFDDLHHLLSISGKRTRLIRP